MLAQPQRLNQKLRDFLDGWHSWDHEVRQSPSRGCRQDRSLGSDGVVDFAAAWLSHCFTSFSGKCDRSFVTKQFGLSST